MNNLHNINDNLHITHSNESRIFIKLRYLTKFDLS